MFPPNNLPDFIYRSHTETAIEAAKKVWDPEAIEEILAAIEWAIVRDNDVGRLVTEGGVRGFINPGAKSMNEPDVDVLYQCEGQTCTILDLTFREPKANVAGRA